MKSLQVWETNHPKPTSQLDMNR